MADDLDKVFEEAVQGIKALKQFPYIDYANRLHNKVRNVMLAESSDKLASHVDRAPTYPEDDPDPDNSFIDIFAVADLLQIVSVPSAAAGIANVDSQYDTSGNPKQYVSDNNSKARYLQILTNLMGFCLGEHINRDLKSQGTRTIDDLWHCGDFQDYCQDAVVTDSFIMNEIMTDMDSPDHLFSIAWLLIADYMRDRDHVYRNAPSSGIDFQDKLSFYVLKQWSYTLWANQGKGDPTQMEKIVKFCGRVATIGLCPLDTTTNLQQPAPTWAVTKAFYNMQTDTFDDDDYRKDLQDCMSRLQHQEDMVNDWHSYCLTLTSIWQIEILPYWNTGMYRAFRNEDFDDIKHWLEMAYDQQDEFRWGMEYLPVIKKPWEPLNKSSGNVVLSGTPILLSNGASRSIEEMCPGDKVLVCNESNSSAIAFRRPIRQSTKRDLVGFNGEKPWALSTQVFCTTTGPRAVDPEAAQVFNPYRRIGKLDSGHILFRMEANESVAVELKSIEHAKQCLLETAFTLSLGSNAQNYYAGGYFIDINDPSHTLKEIVEILRKVPGDKRLGVLSHIQELRSLFGKFEAQAIHQRLNWELFGQYNSPDGHQPPLKKPGHAISYRELINTANALTVYHGVPIDRLERGFCLKAHHPDRLPTGYELPALNLIDGYLLIQGEVQFRSAYDSRKRTLRWTRELKEHKLFEHGALEIYSHAITGRGVIYLSTEEEPQDAPGREEIHTFKAKACRIDQLTGENTGSNGNDDNWDLMAQFKITVDRDIWPPNTERTEPVDPVDGGILEYGFLGGPDQVPVSSMKFPLIDSLRDQIKEKFGPQLGSLYDVTSQKTQGLTTYKIEFNRAPIVPFISDAGLDVEKTFGVSFQPGLGIDITLPSLFQEMTLTVDVLIKNVTGYLYEYDPTKRGLKGNRHLVQGAKIKSDAITIGRSKISHAYGSIKQHAERDPSHKELCPALVTDGLLALSDLSIENLVEFAGYQETVLHSVSQTLIQTMMYYHMDDNQRDKILHQPKPTSSELPLALAENLPDKLKTFFKYKYGPAFICRYVGRTQKYMSWFQDAEMKKLWYWWQGNGKNSLSQSEEYNDINRLSTRWAMKDTYKDQLQPYLDSNPDDWAQQLYTEITTNKALLHNWLRNPIPSDGNNVINKQCNLLDALSQKEDWSKNFFNFFLSYALRASSSAADIEPGNDQDSKYEWLHDSLHDLIMAVLDDDPTISQSVKTELQTDIEAFEKQNGLNMSADSATRAAEIIEKSAIFMQELSGWFSYIGKGLKTAFGGSALWKRVSKAFDSVAEKASSSFPKAVSRLKAIASIAMVCVSLTMVAVSIWGLVTNWDHLSKPKRAEMIFEIARMVIDAVDSAIDSWKRSRSKPASEPGDEIDLADLDNALEEQMVKDTEKMGDIAQGITGDDDYRVAIAEGIQGEGLPTESDGEDSWNEELTEPASDAPPAFEKTAKEFNISGKMLRALNAILGIGLVVAMSFSLANDWNSLNDTGKVLGVLNIIVQGLTILLDIVNIGLETGALAFASALSVAVPILGAVLAVIGIVLMLVQLFINIFVKAQPPPDPIGDFINSTGHDLIATFDESPAAQLSYSISTSEGTTSDSTPIHVKAGEIRTITITGYNGSSDDVSLKHTAITLYSGDDDVSLFRNGAGGEVDQIALALDTDDFKDSEGHTYVTSHWNTAAQLPQPSKLGNTSNYFEYDLLAAGPPKTASSGLDYLVLKAGWSFKSIWTARINYRGDSDETSTSWIELVETGLKDACQTSFSFLRT